MVFASDVLWRCLLELTASFRSGSEDAGDEGGTSGAREGRAISAPRMNYLVCTANEINANFAHLGPIA